MTSKALAKLEEVPPVCAFWKYSPRALAAMARSPVIKTKTNPIFLRSGIFNLVMTGIGSTNMMTSIASDSDPLAIVASVSAVTHENRNGGATTCCGRSGLHEMPAYSSVARPPRIPTTTSTWQVRRSQVWTPKVRMKRKRRGSLAL